MGRPRTPISVRLARYTEVDPETDCWNWTGALFHDGYAQMSMPQGAGPTRATGAHRVSYEHHRGPIPDGLTLDHLCRNKRCINPDHLEPVPIRENILRGEGLAPKNLAKAFCPQGHPYDEVNTYRLGAARHCRTCMNERSRKWRALHPEYRRPTPS